MFRQKYFCVILIVMMFFVVASGGCGGGSSNNSSRSNPNNPSPDNPSPDNPNPNNPETEYSINVLEGTWKASTGTCIFTDPEGTFTLVPGDEGINFWFSDIQQVSDDSANIVMEADIHWKGAKDISGHFRKSTRKFQHIGVNKWRWVVNDPDADDTITITITSPTTLDVEESSTNDEMQQIYSARYTLTKQDSTREYDIVSTLAGTWIASDGTATMTGENENIDMIFEEGDFEFSSIQSNGNTATIVMEGATSWTYHNGSRAGDGLSRGYSARSRQFQRVRVNTWRWTEDDAPYPDKITTLTITSPTTVKVEEARNMEIGTYRYRWTASFTLTKQATR